MVKPLGHGSFAALGDSGVWVALEAIYKSLFPWVAMARGASHVDVSSVRLTTAYGLLGIVILHNEKTMTSRLLLLFGASVLTGVRRDKLALVGMVLRELYSQNQTENKENGKQHDSKRNKYNVMDQLMR